MKNDYQMKEDENYVDEKKEMEGYLILTRWILNDQVAIEVMEGSDVPVLRLSMKMVTEVVLVRVRISWKRRAQKIYHRIRPLKVSHVNLMHLLEILSFLLTLFWMLLVYHQD